MSTSSASPGAQVHRFLIRTARRARALAAADSAATLGTVVLAVLLAGTAVRPASALFRFAPVVFAVLGLAALAVALFLALRAALGRLPLARVARLVESRHPELKSDLTSALELGRLSEADYSRFGTSRPMVGALTERADAAAGRLDPAAIVAAAPLRRRLWLPAALGAAVGAVALLAPALLADSARALVDPLALVPSDAILLEVSPGDATVLRGAPVTIRVRAAGRIPDAVEVALLAGDPVRPDAAVPPRLLAGRPAGDALFVVGPFPAERSLAYEARADGESSRRYRLTVEDPPEVGRIAATYHYPAYLALADKRVEGGTIEAYRGTEVRLAMTANKPVARGRILFDDGSAQPVEVDPQGDGTTLAATLVVSGEGGYRVVLTDRAGFETPEPIRYEIRVVPDDAPTAEITRPGQDITADQGDVVRVEWRAADDIALGAVDLVYEGGQGEQRVSLWRPKRGRGSPAAERGGAAADGAAPAGDARPTTSSGRLDWRLAGLKLAPGTRVAYFVEARDTDVVSGPKKGLSQTYYVQIRSREEEHEKLRDAQRQIADTLLDALGDQLEREQAVADAKPQDADDKARALDQRLEQARQQVDQALARAADDPLAEATQLFDMNLLRSHLDQVREEAQRAGSDPERLAGVTQELEQLATFADEIGKRGEMEDLVRRGRELMRAQTEVLDKLDKEKGKTLDPKARAELEQQLRAIEEQLRKLAEQLAKMPQSLPDEFMNSEAMDALEMQDMADQLEQLREAIRQGDAEKARQLASELAQQLNQMMAALEGAQGESQQADGGQQMQRQMAQQQQRLEQLQREQRDIVNRTEEMDRKVGERIADSQQREWGSFEREVREKLDDLQQRARDSMREAGQQGNMDAMQYFQQRALQDSLREARERLDQRQAQALRQSLEQARDQLRRAPLVPNAREASNDLDRLARQLQQMAESTAPLSPQERQQLEQLAQRQRAVGEQTAQLGREMDDMGANMPQLGPQIGRNLREAVPFMGEAQERLGGRDPRGALTPEREALQRLSRAQQAMQQAGQQMGQRGQMRGMNAQQMAQRGQMPGQMPNGQQPGGQDGMQPRVDQRTGGRAGASVRDFKLPGRDDYQVPRVYREQVIEALREPVPETYRGKVERYFKNLTE
jgi:hypothetical protein